jgi:two-component system response regulator MprA
MTPGTTSGVREVRVLVVDDEPMQRETFGLVLTNEGYVVDLAIDGVDALERVHLARPDVILLNLMMPRMNGCQFLQTLREEPVYANLPVILTTAADGVVLPSALGVSEYIYLPCDADALLNKVALAVYRSRHEQGRPY